MKPYKLDISTSDGYHDVHHLDDPFHRTTVVVGWSMREWFKMLFKRKRELEVNVRLDAPLGAIQRIMTALHEDCQRCGTGDDGYHMDHVGEVQQYVSGECNG